MTRVIFLLFYSLLGIFGYYRTQEQQVLGYLIFMIPISSVVMVSILIQPMLSKNSRQPIFVIWQLKGKQKIHIFFLLLYMAIMSLGFFRAIAIGTRDAIVGLAEVSMFLMVFLFIYVVIVRLTQRESLLSLLKDIRLSIFFLLMMNVIAALLGFKNQGLESKYLREFETLFGISDHRVVFPFSTSGQYLSILAGVLTILALVNLSDGKWVHRYILRGTMIMSSFVILLGHSARAPLAALIGIILFSFIWKPVGRYTYSWIPLGLIVAPFLFVFTDLGSYVAWILDYTGVSFSRHLGDIATLSNRSIIWGRVFNEFSYFDWDHLFGFGSLGHITSGLSHDYSFLFKNSYARPEIAPVHSAYLQILVDYGYVGLGLFILILYGLFSMLKTLGRGQQKTIINQKCEKILGLCLIYIIICSITETNLTYFSVEIWSFFIFLNVYILFASHKIKTRTRLTHN